MLKLAHSRVIGNNLMGGFENDFSINFDGADAYINLDGLEGDLNEDEGTVSLWVRMDVDNSTSRLFSVITDSNNQLELLWIGANDYLRIKYKAGGVTKSLNSAASGQPRGVTPDGATWYHIAATWSKAADEIEVYVNGAGTGTPTTGLGDWSGSVDKTYLGAKADASPSGFYDGLIDEVAIYNVALTEVQVDTIYNSGVPNAVPTTNLIGNWRMGDPAGISMYPSIEDETSNGNTGTMTNMIEDDIVEYTP